MTLNLKVNIPPFSAWFVHGSPCLIPTHTAESFRARDDFRVCPSRVLVGTRACFKELPHSLGSFGGGKARSHIHRRTSAPILSHLDFCLLTCHVLPKSSESLDFGQREPATSQPPSPSIFPNGTTSFCAAPLHTKVDPAPASCVPTLTWLGFSHVWPPPG